MSQQIGWSVESKLLYEIKQLTRQLSGRQYILTFPNFASFPTPGITGTLYVDESTGDIYVWNGTAYTLLSAGITALNGLIAAAQLLVIGSTGTDFNISSVGTTHTFNIPTASATNRGLLSSGDWTTFNNKQNAITLTTTGTSGAATLVGSTLNIPQYQSVLTNPVTGTGTTNYIPKFTASSTIGNSQIFDNGTNVGIGTTSATDSYSFGKALDMHGSNGAALYMRYATHPTVQFGMIGYDRTGLGLYLSTNNALPITFYTSASEKMRIAPSGNVGINKTPNSWDSSLRALQIGESVSLLGSGAAELGSNEFYDGANYKYITTNPSALYAFITGIHRFFVAPTGTAGNNITFTEALRITNTANALIGTTTDAGQRLQINSSLRLVPTSTVPTASAGTLYYDTATNKLKLYDGTSWVDLN
jgi:hypothetical protein